MDDLKKDDQNHVNEKLLVVTNKVAHVEQSCKDALTFSDSQ